MRRYKLLMKSITVKISPELSLKTESAAKLPLLNYRPVA